MEKLDENGNPIHETDEEAIAWLTKDTPPELAFLFRIGYETYREVGMSIADSRRMAMLATAHLMGISQEEIIAAYKEDDNA